MKRIKSDCHNVFTAVVIHFLNLSILSHAAVQWDECAKEN